MDASGVAILLLIMLASPAFGEGVGEGRNLSDCVENYNTLEWALLHTKNNKIELRKAFYPPRKEPSDFVTVHYKFLDEDGTNTTCNKTWLWTSIGIYMIQPPSIYKFMALNFISNPRTNIANLFLPNECRDLVTWKNGSCSCDSNGMLDIITQQLKSYAQYNNPDHIKIDDTLPVQAVCDDIHDQQYNIIVIFFTIGLIAPILYLVTLVFFVRSMHKPIKVAIEKPENHANLAAIALTGTVFTAVVFLMDIYALVLVVKENHEFTLHTSIKEYSLLFVALMVALDALPILYSGITLAFLRFLLWTHNIEGLQAWIRACLGAETQQAIQYGKDEGLKVWLVFTLCFAPLFCIASHSGYIIVGWVSEHSASYIFLYIFSFAYYFILFRHLYIAFMKTKVSCQCCLEIVLICNLLKELYIWSGKAHDYFCCRCRKTEFTTNTQHNEQHAERYDENAGQQDKNIQFELHAFFIVFWIGIFLLILEGGVVVGFWLVPITLDAATTNIYHYAQLASVILTGLITYKIFHAGTGPKKTLQAFLKTYLHFWAGKKDHNPYDFNNSEEDEQLGNIMGGFVFNSTFLAAQKYLRSQ